MIKYFYYRSKDQLRSGYGGYAFGYEPSSLATPFGTTYRFALARCSKKDRFSRKAARELIKERLTMEQGTFEIKVPNKEYLFHHFLVIAK